MAVVDAADVVKVSLNHEGGPVAAGNCEKHRDNISRE